MIGNEMRLKEYGQSLISTVFVVYVFGAMITPLLLGVLGRRDCIQDEGFLGIFGCDVLGNTEFSFFKALLWPYFLYQWLFSAGSG